MKITLFWAIAPCSLVEADRRFRGAASMIIAVMTEAISTSETSVKFYETTYHIHEALKE
jgi:hypothetical protein